MGLVKSMMIMFYYTIADIGAGAGVGMISNTVSHGANNGGDFSNINYLNVAASSTQGAIIGTSFTNISMFTAGMFGLCSNAAATWIDGDELTLNSAISSYSGAALSALIFGKINLNNEIFSKELFFAFTAGFAGGMYEELINELNGEGSGNLGKEFGLEFFKNLISLTYHTKGKVDSLFLYTLLEHLTSEGVSVGDSTAACATTS